MSEIATTAGLVYCDVHGWSKPSRHHIDPTSRGGDDSKENIDEDACGECHPRSHHLFANKKPDEIIEHLVEGLWNGQKKWVYSYLWRDFLKALRKMLGLSPREKHSGVTLQPIQTDRLRRTLEEELRIRKVVRELELETLEGELQSRKFVRGLGLKRGDLYLLNEGDKEVLRWAQSNGGKTRRELLEEVLGGRELEPDESIRSMAWRVRRLDPASDSIS